MAVAVSTRLQIYTWSASTDEFNRAQLTSSHQSLEDRAAIFTSGLLSARPAAAVSNTRGFHLATDQGILYYSDGTTWVALNSYGTPTAIAVGDSIAAGTAVTIARSDHKHSLPPYATFAAATSTTMAAGSSDTFSRGDHVHTVGDNSVTAGKIATGGVSAGTQLASGIVATIHIVDSNVTRAKIVDTERIPTGTIMPYVGTTAPSGWMLCEGGEVLISTELGTLLAGRYNAVTPTATYVRVPDFRSKVPYGVAGSSLALGTTSGGAATVGLAPTNIPNHTHTYSASTSPTTHNHNLSSSGSTVAKNIDHTHNFSHTHDVTVTASPVPTIISETGVLGTVLVAVTGGDRQVTSVTAGTGNVGNAILLKNSASTWTAGTMSSTTVPTTGLTALTAHSHELQGATDNESSHIHGFSGTTTSSSVNATATGTAFSIVPPYTGVTFIIKL